MTLESNIFCQFIYLFIFYRKCGHCDALKNKCVDVDARVSCDLFDGMTVFELKGRERSGKDKKSLDKCREHAEAQGWSCLDINHNKCVKKKKNSW